MEVQGTHINTTVDILNRKIVEEGRRIKLMNTERSQQSVERKCSKVVHLSYPLSIPIKSGYQTDFGHGHVECSLLPLFEVPGY